VNTVVCACYIFTKLYKNIQIVAGATVQCVKFSGEKNMITCYHDNMIKWQHYHDNMITLSCYHENMLSYFFPWKLHTLQELSEPELQHVTTATSCWYLLKSLWHLSFPFRRLKILIIAICKLIGGRYNIRNSAQVRRSSDGKIKTLPILIKFAYLLHGFHYRYILQLKSDNILFISSSAFGWF
jgi:hypothetical protein